MKLVYRFWFVVWDNTLNRVFFPILSLFGKIDTFIVSLTLSYGIDNRETKTGTLSFTSVVRILFNPEHLVVSKQNKFLQYLYEKQYHTISAPLV